MGTRIRQIQTEKKVINRKETVVPVLDAQGQEIELWSIDLPPELEAAGIPKEVDCSDKDAVELWMLEEQDRQTQAKAAAEQELADKQQALAASDAVATEALNAEEK